MFINTPGRKLKRNVGLLLLCLIGIDGTIGGSIFVLLAGGVELAGTYTPLAFLLAGALALLGGLLYAEVGTTVPRPGADVAFVFTAAKKRHYPFLFSWTLLLATLGYLAINALAFAYYTTLATGVSPLLIALAALGLAGAINLRGVKRAGATEGLTLALLLTLFIAFAIFIGVNVESLTLPVNGGGGFSGVMAATALVFTSFIGYEYITTLAGETKNPARTIPIALAITIVFSSLVFAGIAYLAMVSAPTDLIAGSDAPLLAVAKYIGGIGPHIIIATAILATGGSLIAATMVASRQLYAIASEGFFGKTLLKTNRFTAPGRSVIVVTVLAGLLTATQAVNFVAYISNSIYLLSFIVISLSIIMLRIRRPYLPRPFRMPLFPWMPLTTIALASTLLFFVEIRSLLLVALWVATGWAVYLLSGIDTQRWRWIALGGAVFLALSGLGAVLVWLT